jgi:hypothetical protein
MRRGRLRDIAQPLSHRIVQERALDRGEADVAIARGRGFVLDVALTAPACLSVRTEPTSIRDTAAHSGHTAAHSGHTAGTQRARTCTTVRWASGAPLRRATFVHGCEQPKEPSDTVETLADHVEIDAAVVVRRAALANVLDLIGQGPVEDIAEATRTIGDGIATYVQFVPERGARGWLGDEHSPVYGEMWRDLNRCAHFSPDISDAQRHSMYVQMACHSKWGISSWFGGNTWDLEAWRRDMQWSDGMSFGGRCGQRYGDLPGAGGYLFGKLINTVPDPNPSQRAAYFVDNLDGIYVRRHITTTKAYGCMRAGGRAAAKWYPLHFVETYLPMGPLIGDDICPLPPSTGTPPPGGGQTPAQPTPRTVTVYNRVANGPTAMREDTPAYLSTVTRNYCKRDGCSLAGTDMGTGARITAYCQTFGSRTTNGWDANPSDDSNPNLYASTRWYGIRWGDGRTGFLSEVWIQASDRGGLGMPAC